MTQRQRDGQFREPLFPALIATHNAAHLQQLLPEVGVEPAVQHGVAHARAHGQHVAHPQAEEIQLQQTGFYLVLLLIIYLLLV